MVIFDGQITRFDIFNVSDRLKDLEIIDINEYTENPFYMYNYNYRNPVEYYLDGYGAKTYIKTDSTHSWTNTWINNLEATKLNHKFDLTHISDEYRGRYYLSSFNNSIIHMEYPYINHKSFRRSPTFKPVISIQAYNQVSINYSVPEAGKYDINVVNDNVPLMLSTDHDKLYKLEEKKLLSFLLMKGTEENPDYYNNVNYKCYFEVLEYNAPFKLAFYNGTLGDKITQYDITGINKTGKYTLEIEVIDNNINIYINDTLERTIEIKEENWYNPNNYYINGILFYIYTYYDTESNKSLFDNNNNDKFVLNTHNNGVIDKIYIYYKDSTLYDKTNYDLFSDASEYIKSVLKITAFKVSKMIMYKGTRIHDIQENEFGRDKFFINNLEFENNSSIVNGFMYNNRHITLKDRRYKFVFSKEDVFNNIPVNQHLADTSSGRIGYNTFNTLMNIHYNGTYTPTTKWLKVFVLGNYGYNYHSGWSSFAWHEKYRDKLRSFTVNAYELAKSSRLDIDFMPNFNYELYSKYIKNNVSIEEMRLIDSSFNNRTVSYFNNTNNIYPVEE